MEDLATRLHAATTLDQVREILTAAGIDGRAAAAPAAPPYHVPGPYEIALAIGAGLAASGTYATPGAAMAAAWMAVPEFYMARDSYVRDLAPHILAMNGGTDGAAAEFQA